MLSERHRQERPIIISATSCMITQTWAVLRSYGISGPPMSSRSTILIDEIVLPDVGAQWQAAQLDIGIMAKVGWEGEE